MDSLTNFIEKNQQRFFEELFEFIRIPSVSSELKQKESMLEAANFLKNHLLDIGADSAETINTKGHPVVYGQKIIDKTLPTVLVYGHYDVQPVDPINKWTTPPFEPEIREGKIYARGADDDKGQLFMHLKAFEYMMQENLLCCNVKFIIEGEEEIGSPNLPEFIRTNRQKLKADIILLSDTTMLGLETPSLTVGLRGLCYLEVEVTGPNRDLHSGLFGGAVANPVNVLCQMISKLTDDKNRITIPGFYNDVIEYSEPYRKELAKAPFDLKHYQNEIGVDAVYGEENYTTFERTGIRPSLDVCGIWGGFTGEGAKTVLPSKAFAKISMRLVPNQSHKKIDKQFAEYFTQLAPKGIKVKVTPLHGGEGYVTPTDSKAYQAAAKAIEKTFGKKPVPTRSGGSIPVISEFEQILGLKSILMGFGLESDAIHSPNENFPVKNFLKGIETIPWFYKYYTE